MGISEALGSVVVAFRGTRQRSILNWWADLYFLELNLSYPGVENAFVSPLKLRIRDHLNGIGPHTGTRMAGPYTGVVYAYYICICIWMYMHACKGQYKEGILGSSE